MSHTENTNETTVDRENSAHSVEFIGQYFVLPTGMELNDNREFHYYTLVVEYRGQNECKDGGGYRITSMGDEISTTGSLTQEDEYLYSDYRWETFEEALEFARSIVNTITVMGMTYAEWKVKHSQEKSA